MKFLTHALLFCVSISVFSIPIFGFAAPAKSVTITFDRGGLIADYRDRYHTYARKGVDVRIDGECRSACTLVTIYLTADHICITPRAKLIFHSERYTDGTKSSLASLDSLELTLEYPPYITNWLMSHGGSLTDSVVTIDYEDLHHFYVDCPSPSTP